MILILRWLVGWATGPPLGLLPNPPPPPILLG